MKKKLTVTSLASSTIKARKKQYLIMIIGIIFAIMFSSSVILAITSLNASRLETSKKHIGTQDVFLFNSSEKIVQGAQKDGYVSDYGFAKIIGSAYTNEDNREKSVSIAYLDDTAREISYQSFEQGRYPQTENEIAVEKGVLVMLGIDAEIGDEITLLVKTQNGSEYLDEAVEKSYTLVGIADNKYVNIAKSTASEEMHLVPAAFVYEGAATEPGGKECTVSYIRFADFDYDTSYFDEETGFYLYQDRYSVFQNYINSSYQNAENISILSTDYRNYYHNYTVMEVNIEYTSIIGIALMLTSCFVIVNSFNTNLKERKQQIGMLRAVGTTRRQIITIFGREALIISLICTPISLILSCGVVWIISKAFGDDFIFVINPWAVVACAAAGLCIVMISALIPLFSASRITPVQAIRNIGIAQKMRHRKIKPEKSFSVPSLIAKRNSRLHIGSRTAVSILLAATIIFSSFGFSYMEYEKNYVYTSGNDYSLNLNQYIEHFVNYEYVTRGMNEKDKQEIAGSAYIKELYGVKTCCATVNIDEYNDYFKVFGDRSFSYDYEDRCNVTAENYVTLCKTTFNSEYSAVKSAIAAENELLPVCFYGIDLWKLETLEKGVTDGKINAERIAAGDEIILVAPQKAAEKFDEYRNGGWTTGMVINGDVKPDADYVLQGECPYKAGDSISVNILTGTGSDGDHWETPTAENTSGITKEVTIGAIVDPQFITEENNFTNFNVYYSESFFLLTSIQGMENFTENLKYSRLFFNSATEPDEETDEIITGIIEPYLYKYEDSYFRSDFAENQELQQMTKAMLVAMLALIIIAFTLCTAITNNSFTADIRERRRELGTLRAVGLSAKEFSQIYFKQLLSVFGRGCGAGFGIFTMVYAIMWIISKLRKDSPGLIFSPWMSIAFCAAAFALCSINLWLKIRKEMKNSIIDNIREL